MVSTPIELIKHLPLFNLVLQHVRYQVDPCWVTVSFEYNVQERFDVNFPVLKKHFLWALEPVVVTKHQIKFLFPCLDIKMKPSLQLVPHLVDVCYFKDIADVLNR